MVQISTIIMVEIIEIMVENSTTIMVETSAYNLLSGAETKNPIATDRTKQARTD